MLSGTQISPGVLEQPPSTHEGEPQDMALLRRYVDLGSQDAFGELVRRHLSWVYDVCRRGLSDGEMAEDAAQAVFIILSRRAASIPPQTRLTGWLFNTARFVVKDARKQERRYRHREQAARDLNRQRTAPHRDPIDPQVQSALDEALGTLTERDRLVLVMHFYQGLSLAEISSALSISKDTAKKRVARALARLRTRMGRNGRATLTIAALALFMRSQLAQAFPLGFGHTVLSGAMQPDRAAAAANALADRAITSFASASRRLLLAVLTLELMVAVAFLTGLAISNSRRVVATTLNRASLSATQSPTVIHSGVVPAKPAQSTVLEVSDPEGPYRSGADDSEPSAAPPPKAKPQHDEQTAPQRSEIKAAAASTESGSTFAGVNPMQRASAAAPSTALPLPPQRIAITPAPLANVSVSSGRSRANTAGAPSPAADRPPERPEIAVRNVPSPLDCPPESTSPPPDKPSPRPTPPPSPPIARGPERTEPPGNDLPPLERVIPLIWPAPQKESFGVLAVGRAPHHDHPLFILSDDAEPFTTFKPRREHEPMHAYIMKPAAIPLNMEESIAWGAPPFMDEPFLPMHDIEHHLPLHPPRLALFAEEPMMAAAFSIQAIPEPGLCMLGAFSAMLWLRRRRHNRGK